MLGSPDGAEQTLDMADRHGWTVVSVGDDWSTVFDEVERRPVSAGG